MILLSGIITFIINNWKILNKDSSRNNRSNPTSFFHSRCCSYTKFGDPWCLWYFISRRFFFSNWFVVIENVNQITKDLKTLRNGQYYSFWINLYGILYQRYIIYVYIGTFNFINYYFCKGLANIQSCFFKNSKINENMLLDTID